MNQSDIFDNAQTLNQEGEALFQNGEIEKAKDQFIEVINADPDNCRAHNNLGVIYWSLEDIQHAMEYFTKAYEINPYHRRVVLNLLEILASLKQADEALLIGNTYLDQYPEDEDVSKLIMALENIHNQPQ